MCGHVGGSCFHATNEEFFLSLLGELFSFFFFFFFIYINIIDCVDVLLPCCLAVGDLPILVAFIIGLVGDILISGVEWL